MPMPPWSQLYTSIALSLSECAFCSKWTWLWWYLHLKRPRTLKLRASMKGILFVYNPIEIVWDIYIYIYICTPRTLLHRDSICILITVWIYVRLIWSWCLCVCVCLSLGTYPLQRVSGHLCSMFFRVILGMRFYDYIDRSCLFYKYRLIYIYIVWKRQSRIENHDGAHFGWYNYDGNSQLCLRLERSHDWATS